jgi:hypothetical protein
MSSVPTRSRRRRRTLLPAAGTFALVLLALCASALAATGFTRFLLRSGEQPGFKVDGRPAVAKTIASYLKESGLKGKQAAAQTKLLTAAGFTGGAQEQLSGPGGLQGFSLVGTFSKRTGATAVKQNLLTTAISQQKGGGTKEYRFKVPGVPSAGGVTAITGKVATANVYWTEGGCAFGSGLYLPNGGSMTTAAIAKPVIAGVQSLHQRTHGNCS